MIHGCQVNLRGKITSLVDKDKYLAKKLFSRALFEKGSIDLEWRQLLRNVFGYDR